MEFFQLLPKWQSHGEEYWGLGLFVLVGMFFPLLAAILMRAIPRAKAKKSAMDPTGQSALGESAGMLFGNGPNSTKKGVPTGVFKERTNNRIFGMAIHTSVLFCFILLFIPILSFVGGAPQTGGGGGDVGLKVLALVFTVFLLLVFLLSVIFGIKRGLFEWLDPPRA